jgi:hypothetical protein
MSIFGVLIFLDRPKKVIYDGHVSYYFSQPVPVGRSQH